MKNPVAGLATAAPRALDSLLGASDGSKEKKKKMSRTKERTCSFDLDLSGLRLDGGDGGVAAGGSVTGSAAGMGCCGGSIAEGSVATFEELMEGEFSPLDLDWDAVGAGAGGTTGAGTPSPN